ncbi:MAG TPA: M14 family zinc carboxypeptidase, partial [Roseiflexaceae bacterium]
MPTIEFSRYYRYDELTDALKGFADEYSSLATLESIGKSYEGRDIWCMAITNRATGPDLEKPALWLDGNLHATEVTGAMGALHVIQRLLTGYGADAAITRLLDTRVFYIVPRVNPDGTEQYLTTPLY